MNLEQALREISRLNVAMREIAESLDGLGDEATADTVDDDYMTRARYVAEVACGKREPIPGVFDDLKPAAQ